MGDVPDKAEQIFERLHHKLLHIWVPLRIYNQLYRESEPEDVNDLMNEIAPNFFAHTQSIYIDYIALEIAKLLDQGVMVSGDENLSLDRLVGELNEGSELREELERKLQSAEDRASNVVQLRHKRLAHNDREAHRNDFDDLDFSYDDIERSLEAIGDFLNCYRRHTGREHMAYSATAVNHKGVGLLHALRLANDYESLVDEEKVSEERQSGIRSRNSSMLKYADDYSHDDND